MRLGHQNARRVALENGHKWYVLCVMLISLKVPWCDTSFTPNIYDNFTVYKKL